MAHGGKDLSEFYFVLLVYNYDYSVFTHVFICKPCIIQSKLWIGHKLNEVSSTFHPSQCRKAQIHEPRKSIEQEWHRSLMLKFFKPSHNCRGTMKMGHSRLLLFFSIALIYLVIPRAAQHCYDTGNYTSNSTYQGRLYSQPRGSNEPLAWPKKKLYIKFYFILFFLTCEIKFWTFRLLILFKPN